MEHLEGISMRVKRLTDKKLEFGTTPAVSLLDMLRGL